MKYYLILTFVVGLTSCASYQPAKEKKVENEKTFAVPFEKAWTKTIAFVSSNGMNVKTIDKSSGLISFERAYDTDFNSKYMDCGSMVSMSKSTKEKEEDAKKGVKGSENLKVSDGTVSMNFFMEKISDKETKLKINTFGKVIMLGGSGLYGVKAPDQSYPCYSNGEFEKEVFNIIK